MTEMLKSLPSELQRLHKYIVVLNSKLQVLDQRTPNIHKLPEAQIDYAFVQQCLRDLQKKVQTKLKDRVANLGPQRINRLRPKKPTQEQQSQPPSDRSSKSLSLSKSCERHKALKQTDEIEKREEKLRLALEIGMLQLRIALCKHEVSEEELKEARGTEETKEDKGSKKDSEQNLMRFCEWKATEPAEFTYLSVPVYGDDLDRLREIAEIHEEIPFSKIDSRDPSNSNLNHHDSNYV